MRAFLVLAVSLVGRAALAEGPGPPCAGTVEPAYAELGAPPRTRVWERGELPAGWQPPACLGWPATEDSVWVSAAGRMRLRDGIDGLVERVGRISGLPQIRFWSVTRDAWLPLFEKAVAVTASNGEVSRPDFATSELAAGTTLYILSDQNDPLSEIVQSLTVRERTPDLLVVELQNVTSGTMAMIEVLPVGAARTLLHMQREAGDVWTFYTLITVADSAPDLLSPPKAAWVNRAAALYRWFAGIPTDQEPPPAR
ncbi:MAG TPA: hypothetical protein PKA13_03255 [Geminicoccaceae bacterium]|nr:hypothetical protein [Geminicoccus sp.]HMU48765.1 hypothetical protein [Geminicoccaceae bacterium]